VTSGAAPPSASTSRRARRRRLRHEKRRRSSGSATVADSRRSSSGAAEQPREPEREQIAALRHHQRMQLVEHDALERAEQIGRVGEASSSASCSGVVSRMSGGSRRWRWRFEAGVSPVRVSMRIGSPSRRPALEIARDVDRERLQRRDVERVQPALAADAAAGGDELVRWPSSLPLPLVGEGGVPRPGKLTPPHPPARGRVPPRASPTRPGRQKPRERLAGAGRRDQQRERPPRATLSNSS
jgi:hypothetical protein